jgi:3-hydroxyacyl-CoA dehydrogenase
MAGEIRRVAVLGAGTMGHGIAQVAAQAGYEVALYDTTKELVERGLGRIRANLDDGLARG